MKEEKISRYVLMKMKLGITKKFIIEEKRCLINIRTGKCQIDNMQFISKCHAVIYFAQSSKLDL